MAVRVSPLPEIHYNLLYGERTPRSVANATRRDAAEFMQLEAQARISVETEVFPLSPALYTCPGSSAVRWDYNCWMVSRG